METCATCLGDSDPETDECTCDDGLYVCGPCDEGPERATPNTNCLEGMRCPRCGSYEPFRIVVSMTVLMYDAGSEDDPMGGDQDWGDASYCACGACGTSGNVKGFQIPPAD